MVVLTAHSLLNLWERCRGLPPGRQALELLTYGAGLARSDAASLTVGERDRMLIAMRRALFGPQLVARADCPRCGEMTEVELNLASVSDAVPQPVPDEIRVGTLAIRWRPPTAGDIAELSAFDSVEAARRSLIDRCVASVTENGKPLARADWTESITQMVESNVAAEIPDADLLRCEVTCPGCCRNWETNLDIVTFLWSELEAVAHQLLSEVHRLASMYGWREADILAMSAVRRRAYLAMGGR